MGPDLEFAIEGNEQENGATGSAASASPDAR